MFQESDIKIEEEPEYFSVEAEHPFIVAGSGARTSTVPRSAHNNRATDEVHHGKIRATDELAYVKYGRGTDELVFAFGPDSFICEYPECLDWYWQPTKFFKRKSDFTRHQESNHRSWRISCPFRECNSINWTDHIRQHYIDAHLDEEITKSISVRVRPDYEGKMGFALVRTPNRLNCSWCDGGPWGEAFSDLRQLRHHFRKEHSLTVEFVDPEIPSSRG